MLIGNPTQEGVTHKESDKFPICLQCHAPNAARDGKTKLDLIPAYSEGVNCVVCHTFSAYKGVSGHDGGLKLGAQAYQFANDKLQGAHGAFNGADAVPSPGSDSLEPAVNPFLHAANPQLFKTSQACLGCHEQRKNPNGVPVCATGTEVVASGNTVSCQSCHMPISNGFADHTMGGGHQVAMLKRAVILEVSGKHTDKGSTATVQMQNVLAHNFPTGAPFRNVVLRLTAHDAKGEVVWQNFKSNPFKEDPKAVLMLKLTDEKGKPAPPPKAKKIGADTRLKPQEKRTLTYDIPVQGVTRVRAELHYRLLPPPLIEKLAKKLPPEAKKPVLFNQAEFHF